MSTHAAMRGSAGWFARRLAMPGTGRPAPRAASRMVVSLAAPLAVGLATGHARLGMIAALTAFFTALAEPAGGYRTHAITYTFLGLGQALVALLGALTAGTVVWAGLVGLGLGLATGAIVASGSRLSVAGPFPLLLFVVIQGVYPTPGVGPTVLAALSGSAWVVIATLLPIVVVPFLPVEVTVAESWRALALLAGDPGTERMQLMASTAVEQARADIIAAPGVRARWRDRRRGLWGATEAAQRVMITLMGLSPGRDVPDSPELRDLLAQAAAAAQSMRLAALRMGRRVDLAPLDAALARLQAVAPEPVAVPAGRLVERLHDAAASLAGAPPPGLAAIPPIDRQAVIRPVLESMRWGAPGLRHGLRLGIAAGGCMAVFGAMGEQVPFVTHHASWVTITLVDVLAPSLGASVQRVSQRAIGTAVGAIVSAVVIWLVGSAWWLALIAVVAGATAALIRSVNYAWFMALFTPLVLLIVATASPLGPNAALGRMAATVVGCGLGFLIAVVIWPSRTRGTVAHSIAEALRAIADDVTAGIDIARRGEPTTEFAAAHRAAVNRTHHVLQLLDGTAIESMARRDRHDPLADLGSATMALVDETATLGMRMPDTAIAVPGTVEPAQHMVRVLRGAADDIDDHRAPDDPGDMTRQLDDARRRLAADPDPVQGAIVDALDGMLRATREVCRMAARWASTAS